MYKVKSVVVGEDMKYYVDNDGVRVSSLFPDRVSAEKRMNGLIEEDEMLNKPKNYTKKELTVKDYYDVVLNVMTGALADSPMMTALASKIAGVHNEMARRLFGEDEVDKFMDQLEDELED